MTDGLLETIIQLEKRIQADAAEEQARAEAWQTRELAALQTAIAEAHTDREQRYRQLLDARKAELLREGAAMEAAASAWCERMASLDERCLHDVLERHLAAILPGGDNDHPHGQG
jgi:hypothetical protein